MDRRSFGSQRKDRNLRRAIESKRHPDSTDAAIHIQLQSAEPEPSFDIFSAHLGQLRCAKKRHPNLSSVSVAAEHKRNRCARWMAEQSVDVVRAMTQKQDGLILEIAYRCGDGSLDIWLAKQGII